MQTSPPPSSVVDANQEPRLRVAPPAFDTGLADLAIKLATDYGLKPDPWQELVLRDWLATQADGKWASLRCGLSLPRQNGKNACLEVRELVGVIGLGEKILHTAHEVKTAAKHFRRLKYFFGEKADDPAAKFPDLNALVKSVRNVNGQEAIYLKNGGSIEIVARSKGSARGFTVDVIVCDEAQDMSDEDLEALLSTSSAAPLGNPQWIFTGTPPGPKVNGEVFSRVRQEGLEGSSPRACWLEWSALDDVDLDDQDVWRQVNPGLITGRLLWDVVEGERGSMSDEGFGRERLGMWTSAKASNVIDPQAWSEAANTSSVPTSKLTLGIDTAPDGRMTSIALAGLRDDGRWHVELWEQRPGTAWVVGYVADLLRKNEELGAVVIDERSPAVALLEAFEQAKIRVTLTRTTDMVTACAKFLSGVHESQLIHTDQPQMNASLNAAARRQIGDAGWAWSRKTSTQDITALVAATLALWGAQQTRTKKASRSGQTGRTSSGRRSAGRRSNGRA